MYKHKRRGGALIVTTMISCIVLALLAAVALNIAGQTVKTEVWQTSHSTRRLHTLAKTATLLVADTVSADGSLALFGSDEIILNNGAESDVKKLDFTEGPVYLHIKIIGATSRDYTTIATASDDTAKISYSLCVSGDKRTWTPKSGQ